MNFDLKLIIDSFLENKIRVKNVVALASENRQDKTTPFAKSKTSFIYLFFRGMWCTDPGREPEQTRLNRHLFVKNRQILIRTVRWISPENLLLFNICHVDTWQKDIASGSNFPDFARRLLTVWNENLIFWRGRGGGPRGDVVVKRF